MCRPCPLESCCLGTSRAQHTAASCPGPRRTFFAPTKCMLPLPALRTLRSSVQHLPGLYVAGASAVSLVLGGATRVIPFTLFGSYFAWTYLRFLQTRNGVRWGEGVCLTDTTAHVHVVPVIHLHASSAGCGKASSQALELPCLKHPSLLPLGLQGRPVG